MRYLILSLLLLAACSAGPTQEEPAAPLEEPKGPQITDDIFADLDSLDVTEVSVMGVRLGDSLYTAQQVFGIEDSSSSFPEQGVVNLEYGESLGLDATGLIFHFENNILTKISVQPPFNEYLKGETRIDRSKNEVYRYFGIPERFSDFHKLRIFHYDDLGLEIYINRQDMVGFGLILQEQSKDISPAPEL